MKGLLLLVLLAIGGIVVSEAKVTEDQAKVVAINWLNSTGDVPFSSTRIKDVITAVEDEIPLYYIVTFDPVGWVMVSGSENVDAVLGYSHNSRFDKHLMPVQLKSWLKIIGSEVKIAAENKQYVPRVGVKDQWLRLNAKIPKKPMLKSTGAYNAGPLLASKWNQGRYYNELAPLDASSSTGNGHVWIGCVATSMAQIMKYFSYPTTGIGSHSYNHATYGNQSANFGSAVYEWSSMPNSPSSVNNEVAEISYHAAVSVNMMFGPGGSGAYLSDALNSMTSFFRYNSTIFNPSKSAWTDADWKAQIKRDIDNGRPVVYSGYNSNKTEGHAWICDGYSGDYFHFNFGWSGSGDGNYLLTAIDPLSRNYTTDQGALFGIEPITTRTITTPYVVGFESASAGYFTLNGVYAFSSTEKHTGSSSLMLSNSSISSYSLNSASLAFSVPSESNLSFWVKRKTNTNSGLNEQRAVIMAENGYTVLAEIFNGDFNDSEWQNYTFNLAAYAGQNVRLMFVQQNYDNNREQWMYVDDVTITGSNQNLAPFIPSIPIPADLATGVSVNPILKWSGGDPNGNSLTYSVFFGTNSNPPLVGSVFDAQYATTTLSPKTKYYWKISSYDGELKSSGPVWSFTTQGIPPSMSLCGVSSITQTSAKVCGEVVSTNGAVISSKGVCWSKNPNPTTSDLFVSSAVVGSQFNCDLTNLEPFTTYYVRSYAVSDEGTAYSNQQSFITLPGLPVVTVRSASDIKRTSAIIAGNVELINDEKYTIRGVVWSVNSGFNVETATRVSENGNWLSTGVFNVELQGLPGPTKIYYRTFVKNSAGFAFSTENEFETVNTAPIIDLDADNSTTILSKDFAGFVTEQQTGGKIVDYDVQISDKDDDHIQSIKIIVINQLNDEKEYLIVNNNSPSFSVIGNNTDTLLITGQNVIANAEWVTILQQVNLFIDNDAPNSAFERKIEVSVFDGYDFSLPVYSYLKVIPVNDIPIVVKSPKIDVVPVFGQSISVIPGVWSDELDDCSGTLQRMYQWLFKDAQGNISTLQGKTGLTLQVEKEFCGGELAVNETIIDSNCGGSNTVSANNTSSWFPVQKAQQTITFDQIPTLNYSSNAYLLTGSSISGGQLTFEVSNKSIAYIQGDQLYTTAVGKTVVSAFQEGNVCYNASDKLYRILNVEKGVQQIVYQNNIVAYYHEGSIPLSAQSTAGLELQVESSDPQKAYVENGRIYLNGTGEVTLTAWQDGNEYLAPSEQVTIKLKIERGTQSINVNVDNTLEYGSQPIDFDIEITSGLPPTVTSSNQSVIEIENKQLKVVGVGKATINITQNGNDYYNAAQPVSFEISVEKGSNIIDFSVEEQLFYGKGPYSFNASSSAGLPVLVDALNSSLIDIVGNEIFVKGVGEVKLQYSTPETSLWKETVMTKTITIEKGTQLIETDQSILKHYGDEAFIPNVKINSGLPVIYNVEDQSVVSVVDGKVNINGVGTTLLTIMQEGTNNWKPVQQQVLITIVKGQQKLTFMPIATATYGDKNIVVEVVSNTQNPIILSSMNENVATVSGNTLYILNAGETQIIASQQGSELWADAEPVSYTFTVNKANQEITFDLPLQLTTSDVISAANFKTNSGLTVDEIKSSNDNIVKIEGDLITILDRGKVELTAIQYGNENYNSASITVDLEISFPVGVSEFNNIQFSIYPNPANNFVNIKVAGRADTPCDVSIFNLNGELLKTDVIKQNSTLLRIEELKRGVYFVRLTYGQKVAIKKLIVK